MSTLPTDVAMRIFEILPHATAACLGLNCRGLYACLKIYHPQPIWLGSTDCSDSSGFRCDAYSVQWNNLTDGTFLWELLGSWMGSNYESRGFLLACPVGKSRGVLRFVNPMVYSELDEFLRKQLPQRQYESDGGLFWSRYRDWTGARLNPKNPIDCRYQKCESRLPNPYNKGLDWFPEAIEAIKADITRFDDIEEWRVFWSSFRVFRNNTVVFDDFFDECSLDQMSEGLKLLGL
jgi:hypothetical protein